MDNLFFDRSGRPVSAERYGELRGDRGYWRIAETTIGQWWVSTVWLGIDHAFGNGPPVIFETMPFYKGDDLDSLHPELRDLDQTCWRYGTEAEAVAGHDRYCVDLRVLIENVRMADEIIAEALAKGSGPDQGSGN